MLLFPIAVVGLARYEDVIDYSSLVPSYIDTWMQCLEIGVEFLTAQLPPTGSTVDFHQTSKQNWDDFTLL